MPKPSRKGYLKSPQKHTGYLVAATQAELRSSSWTVNFSGRHYRAEKVWSFGLPKDKALVAFVKWAKTLSKYCTTWGVFSFLVYQFWQPLNYRELQDKLPLFQPWNRDHIEMLLSMGFCELFVCFLSPWFLCLFFSASILTSFLLCSCLLFSPSRPFFPSDILCSLVIHEKSFFTFPATVWQVSDLDI